MKPKQSYTLVIRRGQPDVCHWERGETLPDKDSAYTRAGEISSADGVKVLVHDTYYLDRIGMPEGWGRD